MMSENSFVKMEHSQSNHTKSTMVMRTVQMVQMKPTVAWMIMMMTMETTEMVDTTMMSMYSTVQMMARNTLTQWAEFFAQKAQA